MVKTDEERKEKKRKYDREYYSRPEVKAKRKKYYSRPENMAKRKEYDSRPEVVKRRREVASRPENKLKDKEYSLRPEVVKRRRELASRPEVYARYRAQNYKKRENLKFKTYSVYSKRHSNSDIPCCRCCGENSFIEFLTIDHIDGRAHLPKEQKNLKAHGLVLWLTRNNYPEGHQILCWNCNVAKSDKECPHLEMRK